MVPHLLSRYKKKNRKNEGRKKENISPGELQQGTENGVRKKGENSKEHQVRFLDTKYYKQG